jgi:hypothetical protein
MFRPNKDWRDSLAVPGKDMPAALGRAVCWLAVTVALCDAGSGEVLVTFVAAMKLVAAGLL